MTDPTDSGQETVQDDTIDALVKKNGTAKMPDDFGSDGNAIALVCSAKNALKRQGWPRSDIRKFQNLALSGDYHCVLTSCLKALGSVRFADDNNTELQDTLNEILNPKED